MRAFKYNSEVNLSTRFLCTSCSAALESNVQLHMLFYDMFFNIILRYIYASRSESGLILVGFLS
jgi:hypothetical protein